MQNVTLEIEDELLERVAVIAARNKTTVEAIAFEYLTEIARREDARKSLLDLMDRSEGRMAPDSKFDREATYDREPRPPSGEGDVATANGSASDLPMVVGEPRSAPWDRPGRQPLPARLRPKP